MITVFGSGFIWGITVSAVLFVLVYKLENSDSDDDE